MFREQAKVLHTHSASTHDVTCAGERESIGDHLQWKID